MVKTVKTDLNNYPKKEFWVGMVRFVLPTGRTYLEVAAAFQDGHSGVVGVH